jgi:hypothetical protein
LGLELRLSVIVIGILHSAGGGIFEAELSGGSAFVNLPPALLTEIQSHPLCLFEEVIPMSLSAGHARFLQSTFRENVALDGF